MDSNDRINRKVLHLVKGLTQHWAPQIPSTDLLWCDFVGRAFWPDGYWIHHRKTHYLDVQIVEKGLLSVQSDSDKKIVRENSLILIPPGEFTLKAVSPGGLKKKHFSIRGSLCLKNLALLKINGLTVIPNYPDEEFLSEFDTLYRLAESKNSARIIDYIGQVSKIMILLSEHVTENSSFPQPLSLARHFVEINFATPFTSEDVCHYAGCCKTVLQSLFKKHMHMTLNNYLTELRMNYAKRLIQETEYPFKEIAKMCGYNNPLYFSNVFKKHTHYYPREYKNSYLHDLLKPGE